MYQEIKGYGKINMIKAIREYCLNTFGVTPGLKVSKDLADDIFRIETENKATELRNIIASARNFGYTFEQVEGILQSEYGK